MTPAPSPTEVPPADALWTRIDRAIAAARQALLDQQQPDGHWCARLEGDSILESEYVLTKVYLGRGEDPKVGKAAEALRRAQRPEGGWSLYPDGPADVSASIKAYLVLKLMGDDPAAEPMTRAREAILDGGGLEAANSFTKIYLSIFGLYRWDAAPAVPPELVLLPGWFPCNLYEMSSWSRAIVVPLSIIWARKPRRELPVTLDELDAGPAAIRHPALGGFRSRAWGRLFTTIDRFIKAYQAVPFHPLRQGAVEAAERWILERLEASDGLGAIFPPIVNTIIALESLGYAQGHPVLAAQIRELEKLEIEDDETLRVQPCKSPVWDTALAMTALASSTPAGGDGDPEVRALERAAEWLLAREVRRPGDWRNNNPKGPVGGWYFEYANEFYPDCDDTAEVLKALALTAPSSRGDGVAAAIDRGRAWLVSMQNRDGGWASFDRGCDREILTYIPFADHNAMIDPSTVDITGRALEALAALGADSSEARMERAIGFVRSMQEPDGSWYGRWGCNYLYGTWLALTGLAAAGVDLVAEPWGVAARDWIRSRQNPDGGWGETLASYEDPELKGRGTSTPSQTAWALLGLLAAGHRGSEIELGIAYLLERQLPDGTWTDEAWTGTGFPKVFYLKYHNYPVYFPLQALAEFRRLDRAGNRSGAGVS